MGRRLLLRPSPPAPSLPTCNISSRLRWGYSVSPRGAWGSGAYRLVHRHLLSSVSISHPAPNGVAPPPHFRSRRSCWRFFLAAVLSSQQWSGLEGPTANSSSVTRARFGARLPSLSNVRAIAAVVALTGCALVLVLGTSASALLHQRLFPNRSQFQTVYTLESLHLHKGYAEYWDAGIDRFLSRHSLTSSTLNAHMGQIPITSIWESDKGMLTVRPREKHLLRPVRDRHERLFAGYPGQHPRQTRTYRPGAG